MLQVFICLLYPSANGFGALFPLQNGTTLHKTTPCYSWCNFFTFSEGIKVIPTELNVTLCVIVEPMVVVLPCCVAEPGPVEDLRVIRRGSTHFDVAWERPLIVNGLLIGYSIVYEGNNVILIKNME